MAKGRKLALIAAGIGVYSFTAFEPSFTPGMWASTSALTDSRTDWRAELSNDVDDIDIMDDIGIWEHYTPVPVMPPRHRIPSKNVDVLAALGAIPSVYAQGLYNEAAGGNKYARDEIAKIRRKAKAVQTVPRRSATRKCKQILNMREIEKARKLSDTGMLSVEDARSMVAQAFSGSLPARDQIRQIRQKLSDTSLLSEDEARSLFARSLVVRSLRASRRARERAQLEKASEKTDSYEIYSSMEIASTKRSIWQRLGSLSAIFE